MKNFLIGSKTIGEGHRPFFIAELGTCHQGSVVVAKENAKAAADAGADCIKTETFFETEVHDSSAKKNYATRTKKYNVSLIEHMRRYQFTFAQHAEIKAYSDDLGLPFMATVHERKAVDFMVEIGAHALKIASPDIVHFPIIEYAAQSGLPLFLDTGGAYVWEVEEAVQAARNAGCQKLVVNHNPSGHPAPADSQFLCRIPEYKRKFDLPIGLSDHYDGYEMMWAAVAVGANCIEKPISENRFIEECEHLWAISRPDLVDVIGNLHKTYDAVFRTPEETTRPKRPENPSRVALIAKKDLSEGERLTLSNVVFGKPRLGVGVEHWGEFENQTLQQAKKGGEYIQWGDVSEK